MENCKDYLLPYYTPEQAVSLWCKIPEDEFNLHIGSDFKQLGQKYPCFPKRLVLIIYAIDEGLIRVGRDGKSVAIGEHVAPARRTVTPADLKEWFLEYMPNERPEFIFNHLERKELKDSKALYEQVIQLQNENDHLKHRLENAVMTFKEMNAGGKETKQQKRERAFKFWLAGKSYSLHKLDQTKVHINDMTRSQVWQALQAVEPMLFNANEKEFFDKQQLAIFIDYV